MSGRPWIKQFTNQIDDARLAQCSDAAQRDYFMLKMLAGRLDADGHFHESGRQLSDDEIAFKIRVKSSRLKATIGELKKARLIFMNGKGPVITDWENEQINWRQKQDADRERQARHRTVTRDNEEVTRDGEAVTPPDQIPDQRKIRSRPDKKKKRKEDPHPPTPSSKKAEPKGAGKAGEKILSLSDLPKSKWGRAETAMGVLKTSGLRNPKLRNLSVILATRHFKNDGDFLAYLLAGLASSYADDGARDKASVAAYRIENDQVPVHFKKPEHWSILPKEILQAAGIEDLNEFRRKGWKETWGIE